MVLAQRIGKVRGAGPRDPRRGSVRGLARARVNPLVDPSVRNAENESLDSKLRRWAW